MHQGGEDSKKKYDLGKYRECMKEASIRKKKGDLNLCPRGYCTVQQKFDVYPSAYANIYASKVCQGLNDDLEQVTKKHPGYANFTGEKLDNPLHRWIEEKWVNVCKKGKGPGGYASCGSGEGIDKPEKYPYCRPYYKLKGTTVKTVGELSDKELKKMCRIKRGLKQGIDKKPTRIFLKQHTEVYNKNRKDSESTDSNDSDSIISDSTGGYSTDRGTTHDKYSYFRSSKFTKIPIPKCVKKEASIGNKLRKNGFGGGTETGWKRGLQLENQKYIDIDSLGVMRTWFARHGPDASNGGTSYPSYMDWYENKVYKPNSKVDKDSYRGAVSWLLWGGNAAYEWLKTKKIRNLLGEAFPARKEASGKNNLFIGPKKFDF